MLNEGSSKSMRILASSQTSIGIRQADRENIDVPLSYLRRLTSIDRTESANRHLARYLALIAGAANAGGFLAVHQYTSHMSGIVSAAADNLATGQLRVAFEGLIAVAVFISGAYVSTVLIRWGKVRGLQSSYALPLLFEAVLLAAFGMIAREFLGHCVHGMVLLLCFTMGLQNAMITKISGTVIRTTHLTGMVTDVGITIGRLSTASSPSDVNVTSEFATMRLLVSLVLLFFLGGIVGAFGFKQTGPLFTLPMSFVLFVLAIVPVVDDFKVPASRNR